MQNQIRFLLNSISYPVRLNFEVLNSINNAISTRLFQDHEYHIHSDVSAEVFQSFINYLFQVNTDIPNITPDNIEQYYLLNEEFQSNTIANLIETQRAKFDEFTVNLRNLRNPHIKDKSRIEQLIAHNLDEYVTEHGEELISSPIQSLMRIFKNNDKVLTQHNQIYSLIISEYQRTNNSNILSLLPTLELEQLSPENQIDSIEQKESRFGMIPEPDLLSMKRKIEEQKQEIDRIKENYNKIALIFIRKHLLDTNEYNEENETELLRLFEDGDDEKASSILPIEIESGHLKFQLNLFDKTAKIIPIDRDFNIDEIMIPKSIRYHDIEFFVTKIDEKAIAYSNIRRIVFPQDSQVRYIHKSAFYFTEFNVIILPPLLEIFSLSWTSEISYFGSVQLYENSSNFTMINNQILLGKSDKNNDVFDIIHYVNPNTLQVNIPNDVTKISEYAFAQCNELTTVNISENSLLKTIDQFAFCQTKIESITIPSHVDFINKSAFSECMRLRTVNLPENLQFISISESVFNRTLIASITIPSNVEYIHDLAFAECKQLRTVNFSENSKLKFIGERAFYETSIETITIPKHVKKIKSFAFAYCRNLTTVDFEPNSELKSFDPDVFSDCSIHNLTIPRNVEELKQKWYVGLNISCNISVSPDNHNFMLINNNILLGKTDNNSDNFDILVFARRDIEEANIPDYIKIIGPFSFEKCFRLRTIHFTENSQLTKIDNNAFSKSSLRSIIIPKTVTTICSYAFSNSVLHDITIPLHVNIIEELAFENCKRLSTINFAQNSELRSFSNCIFSGCSIQNLTIPRNIEELKQKWYVGLNISCNISISPDNHNFMLINNNILLGKTDNNSDNFDILVFARRDIEEANIPDYIKIIGPFSFEKCARLRTIHFTENSQLTKIDNNAFSESSLPSISIPKNVTTICSYAFAECQSLREIVFQPNSKLRIIDEYAFKSSQIRTITIPNNVTEIGNCAFKFCKNLNEVIFQPVSELRVIGSAAFMLSSLRSIIIPSRVTQIKAHAFSECTLQSIVFPEDSQLREVDNTLFYSSTVRNATIPQRLTNLIHINQ